MRIAYHKNLEKQLKKIPTVIKQKFIERIKIFQVKPFDPILRNHKLKGEFEDCNSIDITGDWRAVYVQKGEIAVFFKLGTHSDLY